VRHFVSIVVVVAGLALTIHAALAHAALRHAVPSAGATLDRSPDELTIEFSEAVVQARVELTLTAEGGRSVDLVEPEAQPATGTLVRRVIGARLAAGTYNVFWRVISVDGHWTRGDYSFEIKSN
jgi:methionine-rich copper-binding protein CopC